MSGLVKELLDRIGRDRKLIAVIGDAVVDQWVHGKVDTCQDGCQKFVRDHLVEVPGGAANAGRSICNWGVETELFGFVYSDRPVKTRYVADGKIVFRADSNELPGDHQTTTRGARYHQSRALALDAILKADAVLISDYDKGYLTPEFVRAVAVACHERGIPCVADCKRPPEIYRGCILKGNADYWGKYLAPPKAELVVTRGGSPPMNFDTLEYSSILPPVTCRNHVGAGDCFAAHLTLALAYGFSLKKAAAIAHSAGRVYVQYPHNRPPMPAEVEADLSSAM